MHPLQQQISLLLVFQEQLLQKTFKGALRGAAGGLRTVTSTDCCETLRQAKTILTLYIEEL